MDKSELMDLAAKMARENPAVSVEIVPPVSLTGVTKIDAQRLTGFDNTMLEELSPEALEALVEAAKCVYGGLGQRGVTRWFLASGRFENLRNGNIEDVVAEARKFMDSPFT